MNKIDFEGKTVSDFTSPGHILSVYFFTPEYILFDYIPMLSIIPVINIKSMINKIIFTERETVPGYHDKARELMVLSEKYSHMNDEDYKKEIKFWYQAWGNVDTSEHRTCRNTLRDEKLNEAKNIEMRNFENSLVPDGKVVFCDIGGFPEKVVSIVNCDGDTVILSEDYSLMKDKYNRWNVYLKGEKVYCEPRIYIDGTEDFIAIRNGLYPVDNKKKNYKAKLVSSNDFFDNFRHPVDYIFDINNYVKKQMTGISSGSIMTYMNRVFGPFNLSGDSYKDLSGSWMISTPDKNMILRVYPANTTDDYSCFWFRFYMNKSVFVDMRNSSMETVAYYTAIMKQTLDYLLRPTNERDLHFNIVGRMSNSSYKKLLKPYWASTVSLSFLTENQKTFNDFYTILNQQKGKNEHEKLKNLIKNLK